MSTLNIVPKIIKNGNGQDTIFSFGFPAENKTDIKVFVLRAGANAEYEVPYGDFDFNVVPTTETGGEIIFPGVASNDTVLEEGDKLCIMRSSNFGNDYIFTNQSRLFPSSVEDADDALSLQILELARDLSLSVKASVFDNRSPKERWDDINRELKRAQEILNYIDKDILGLPAKLQQETSARQAQDSAILNTISANKEEATAAHNQLASKVEQEKIAREKADEGFVKKETTPEVVSTVTGSFTDSRVSINVTKKDTGTGVLSDTLVTLPVASESQHGVMPKETFAEVKTLGAKVAALEGSAVQTYALNLGLAELSQEEYQAAWEQAAGVPAGSVPPNGTKLVNLDNNSEIQYFSTSQPNPWVVRGAANIPLATNTSSGVVKGDAVTEGKVAVEGDGTMSVVGFDAVKGSANDAVAAASSEATRAKAEESRIDGNLTAHINDNVRHVTESEKTTWNNKYTKPSEGISSTDMSADVRQVLETAVTTTVGGTMVAQLVARSVSPEIDFETRNIKAVPSSEDPGVGAELATGNILFVYE